MMQGLYVHVPFCPTLCPYCDFEVVRRGAGLVEAYLSRLAQQALELYAKFPQPLGTLYLGGGTPSFLREDELKALFRALPWNLDQAEVTLEANPGTLNAQRLAVLLDHGVNRISLGVQSFQDPVLKQLGRAHGRKGALKAVELLQNSGVRMSLDLILGLPGQDVLADLNQAAELQVGHISAYTLQVEPGTPFAAHGLEPDPDLEAEAFDAAEVVLGKAGLQRYEISNFARPGQESQHNLLYWHAGFWGALGPGASAQLPGHQEGLVAVRSTYPPLHRWLAGEEPAQVALSPQEYAKEALMMGLRLRSGLHLGQLSQRCGWNLETALSKAVNSLVHRGWLWREGSQIGTTAEGERLLHQVILALWEALEDLLAPTELGPS